MAARALPSGDVVVTFRDEVTRDWHRKDTAWIRGAFGGQAKEAKRTVAILIKGLRKADLQGVTEEDLVEELGLESVDKVKTRLPSTPEYTRATVFLALTDQEEARKACDNGLIWRAQIFHCEPYSAMLDSDSAERILYAQNVAHRPTDLEGKKEKPYALLIRE